jgi:hypothetical protein
MRAPCTLLGRAGGTGGGADGVPPVRSKAVRPRPELRAGPILPEHPQDGDAVGLGFLHTTLGIQVGLGFIHTAGWSPSILPEHPQDGDADRLRRMYGGFEQDSDFFILHGGFNWDSDFFILHGGSK